MTHRRLWPWVWVAFLVGTAAQAQERTPPDPDLMARRESAAWRLIASLQSPFCPGLTLESCPSWYADSLRGVIRERMAAGESPERIRSELAGEFGQRILGEPTWQGFDLLGWVGPGAVIVLSMLTLGLVLRRRVQGRAEPLTAGGAGMVPPLPELAPVERARLAAVLERELRGGEPT
ncbi:MAG TPA: cytochrome c-type biogenesis protein CcmH [Gemmatimonadales bacterium]|nr:cytochrome c-type biogenesis protein CcmH [Gemmatimonadales bacterium]